MLMPPSNANIRVDELAGFVGHYLASIKNFQQLLGQPITTGKYWLDIDFPDGPPPDYERVGYEGLSQLGTDSR